MSLPLVELLVLALLCCGGDGNDSAPGRMVNESHQFERDPGLVVEVRLLSSPLQSPDGNCGGSIIPDP